MRKKFADLCYKLPEMSVSPIVDGIIFDRVQNLTKFTLIKILGPSNMAVCYDIPIFIHKNNIEISKFQQV